MPRKRTQAMLPALSLRTRSRMITRHGCSFWSEFSVPERKRANGADRLRGAGLGNDVREQRLELRTVERLLLEERLGDAVESRAVLDEQSLRLLVGEARQPRRLGVAQPLGLLGERVVVGAHRPSGGDL